MQNLEIIEQHQTFGGTQTKYRHDSELLHCSMTFQLFLPQMDRQDPLPLFWFLAGLSSSDENFTTKAGMQRLAAKHRLAFVMPDTSPRGADVPAGDNWDIGQGAGFYLNASQDPWARNYRMYDYLTQELPKLVYDLIPSFSGQEVIMGHSMGGYGALEIGMKNPDRFTSISAFAPITNPTQVPWGIKAFTSYLGPNQEDWKEWDTVELVKRPGIPPILITQGTQDPFYAEQLDASSFLQAAESTHNEVIYRLAEGYDHSYYFIATFLEEHINFHMQHIEP